MAAGTAGNPGTRPTGRGPRFAGQHAGDTFTTGPGCRSAAGTSARPEILEHGPPRQGPRFAGQHAGDTFTTRPGCRSVWTAAGTIGTAGDPGTRSTTSRPSLCWPACRRRSATRLPRGRAVDRCGRPATRTPRPGCRSVDGRGTAAGTIGTAGDPGTRSTRSRPSLCWPACRRRSATRSPRGRAVDRCGRPRARALARPEILEHVHQVKALALLASMPATRSPRGRVVDRCGWPRALAEILEHVHRVEALASLASMPAPIGDTFTTRPGCRSVWTAAGAIGTGGDPGTRPPGQGPRFAGQHAGDTFTTRPGCRSVWMAAGTAGNPGTRPPGRGPRFAHHGPGLSIGVDGRGYRRHWRRSWNTSTGSRPSLRWPACRRRSATRSPRARAVDRCGRPRAPSARPEILEHVHQVEALASLASMPATAGDTFTTRPGCRSVWTAAGTIGTAGDPGTRSTRSRPSLCWPACRRRSATRLPRGRAVDRCGRRHGRGHHRHGRRSWNTVHQVKTLALLASMPATIGPGEGGGRKVFRARATAMPKVFFRGEFGRGGSRDCRRDTFTTGPGCRSVGWPRARPRAPSARPEILEHGPPGQGPRFAGQHAGDTFTTRPGCRSVWTAAGTIGTGGDPGTGPPGRGPRFAGQHAGDDRRHVHHGPGLSIGGDARARRGHHRHGRRSWNTSTRLGPCLAHHAAGLSIGPDGRGHGRSWWRSWNTSTGSRPSLCSPRARAVDRCGPGRISREMTRCCHSPRGRRRSAGVG